MKRTQQPGSTRSGNKDRNRLIEANHLIDVRGGGDLGIAVAAGIVVADYISQQHNEALIRI